MSDVLVLYYSFEGNTKKIADFIAETIKADIKEIKPTKEMKSKGFSKYIFGGSQVVMGKKPPILPLEIDFSKYNTIFIGSPIWAGTFAPPIKTLLEDGNIEGKKIAYFYTHEGGASKAVEKAKIIINFKNLLISSEGFINVSKSFEELKSKIEKWAKECLSL